MAVAGGDAAAAVNEAARWCNARFAYCGRRMAAGRGTAVQPPAMAAERATDRVVVVVVVVMASSFRGRRQ